METNLEIRERFYNLGARPRYLFELYGGAIVPYDIPDGIPIDENICIQIVQECTPYIMYNRILTCLTFDIFSIDKDVTLYYRFRTHIISNFLNGWSCVIYLNVLNRSSDLLQIYNVFRGKGPYCPAEMGCLNRVLKQNTLFNICTVTIVCNDSNGEPVKYEVKIWSIRL